VAKRVTTKKKFWAFKALANNEAELTIYGRLQIHKVVGLAMGTK